MDNKAEETLNNLKAGMGDLMAKLGAMTDSVSKMMPVSEVKETEINGISCKIFMDANGLARIEFKNREDGKRFFNDPNKEIEKLQDECKKLNVDYLFVKKERETIEERYRKLDEILKKYYKATADETSELKLLKTKRGYKFLKFIKAI